MAKKSISAWKQKTAYKILAPENFDFKEIGSTLANNPKLLVGRNIDVSVMDFTGDRSKQQIKLFFEITEVKENKAHTSFKRLETDTGYLRSKTRKGMTKIDYITDVQFQESKTKIKIIVLAHERATASHKRDIKVAVGKALENHKGSRLGDFIPLVVAGKVGTEIYHAVKVICPINRVEIWQVKAL